MGNSYFDKKLADEGYIYVTYGDHKYLKHAIASIVTLRRYDKKRPVALFCSKEHRNLLEEHKIEDTFTHIFVLPPQNQSITGFKHNLYKFIPFEKNLFTDSDILWCRNPDNLWKSFSGYSFTITGNQIADLFFGATKGVAILKDYFLGRRAKTLKKFDLTYLSRVQAGMIYTSDDNLAKQVCEQSKMFFDNRKETHFRSRIEEQGRNEESCEWSLAMAMAKLKLQVYPWLNGYESPQLDFIEDYTTYNQDFKKVECLVYSNRFVYDLKALKSKWLQTLLIKLLSLMPGKGDYLYVTPYCLHFGWYHQKEPLDKFSESCWHNLIKKS